MAVSIKKERNLIKLASNRKIFRHRESLNEMKRNEINVSAKIMAGESRACVAT